MTEALAWADELVAKAPLALRYAKQAVNAAIEENLGDTISGEASLQHICIGSADASEGVMAFIEKRAPNWQGR
jgi:2-(1,2-epoxy-1,2-dihydrophenyl)acetyl-CoA isomerase